MFQTRPYQDDALAATAAAHQIHDSVLLELATGTGKTVIFCRYAANWRHGRTMIICPFRSIIDQTCKKIYRETGDMPAIEQASLWSNESEWFRSQYIVASKDSLCSSYRERGAKDRIKRYERFQDIGLVIVDEAHYAVTELYANLISYFRQRGAKILGVTATPKRHDKRAMGQVFDDVAFQYGILDAVSDGYLVPVRPTVMQLRSLDLSGVSTTHTFAGRDFNTKELNERLEDPRVIYEIAEACVQETAGKKTAIFCSSVEEARAVADLLHDQYGFRASWICADPGRCSEDDRAERIASFQHDPNGITHLANVGILTTGWDMPGLECIVNARPTKSLSLYTQIFGRLTRPIEGDNGMSVVDGAGLDTPDRRRAAIASSRKPFGRMIDLVDASLAHKIQTATDVLGGNWSLVVRERVNKELLNKTGPVDIENLAKTVEDEILKEEEERRQAEAEAKRREEEGRLRRQRSSYRGRAEFKSFEANPYAEPTSTIRQRSQSDMATTPQIRYLWVLGFKDASKYHITKPKAGAAIKLLKTGIKTGANIADHLKLQRKAA